MLPSLSSAVTMESYWYRNCFPLFLAHTHVQTMAVCEYVCDISTARETCFYLFRKEARKQFFLYTKAE